MGSSSKVEYVHTDQLIAANYVKNAKAIGFLWGIFSVCYAIILVVVFVQPQWVGSSTSSIKTSSSSYFGPWRSCAVASVTSPSGGDSSSATTQSEFICRGRLDDFSSIVNPAFRVATVFMGIAMLVAVLSVFALVLFVCAPAKQSYYIVAIMQTLAAITTSVSLLVFPSGFDSPEVHLVCGPLATRYNFGGCSIRWAYVLAIIGLLDGIVLAILGFVLGSRHVKLAGSSSSDDYSSGSIRKIHSVAAYPPHSRLYYGGGGGDQSSNSAAGQPVPSVTYSYASTKRSSAGTGSGGGGGVMHPVVFVPPHPHHMQQMDVMEDMQQQHYRSKASLYRAEYATPKQNFQL